MHRKFTFRERIAWRIVGWLDRWLEKESNRQWAKLEGDVSYSKKV